MDPGSKKAAAYFSGNNRHIKNELMNYTFSGVSI